MTYTIENEFLRVRAKTLSAELSSLYSKPLEREFLWQPGEEIFANQAKNLFPNVGMVNMERFFIKGKEYMGIQHGFAKDSEFTLVSGSGEALVFELRSGEETKKYLPYDFVLQVVYELSGDSLLQTYRVENLSDEEMYFGIGAHTGFFCPIALDEKAEDYLLNFGDCERLTELLRDPVSSLRNGDRRTLQLENGELSLRDSFFDDGAKILTGFSENSVRLYSKKLGLFIELSFEGFPYLTLWSRSGRLYYICIEPWCGLPDSEITDHVFERKEGNIMLPAGRVFERTQVFRCGKEPLANR